MGTTGSIFQTKYGWAFWPFKHFWVFVSENTVES